MGASPVQYDFTTGFDFSSVDSVQKTQLMQAINQIVALSNIGGVVWLNGGGGSTWPGTTNNPRFIRFIWIDTYTSPPVAKVHKNDGSDAYASWVDMVLTDNAVTTAKIAALAVTLAKLAPSTTPLQVYRTNSGGTAVEWVNPGDLFSAGDIDVSALENAFATNLSVIQKTATGVGWTDIAALAADILSNITSIELTKLSGSGVSNGDIIKRVGGAWVNKPFTLANLEASGASANQVPVFNGSAWIPTDVGFTQMETYLSDTLDVIEAKAAGTRYAELAHSFGVNPTHVRVTWYCSTGDANFIPGDEVDFYSGGITPSWIEPTTSVRFPLIFPVHITNSYVRVIMSEHITGLANYDITYVCQKGSSTDSENSIVKGSWKWKIYAFK